MPKSKFPRPMSGKLMQGILKKPIDEPDGLLVALLAHGCPEDAKQEMYRISNEYVNEQRAARVAALAEHYGAQPEDNLASFLFLRLAEDFVVGFRKNAPGLRVARGRRKGPSHYLNTFELSVAATDLLRKKHSKKRACEILATRRESRWYGENPKGLLERLNRYFKWQTDILDQTHKHPVFSKLHEIAALHKKPWRKLMPPGTPEIEDLISK